MECSVVLEAHVPDIDAEEAFTLVSDFERYAELTEPVLGVVVSETADGGTESAWRVTFRRGVLEWTERDVSDPANHRITFEQTKGDFARFTGHWAVRPTTEGVFVDFASRFDLGIASLASLVDPVACTALRDGIREILTGLFGSRIVIKEVEAGPVTA